MKKIQIFLICAVCIALASGCKNDPKRIVIGAKGFTEQDILGNVLSLLIKTNTDLEVDYKQEMGSNVLFAAIKSGDVDVCIDYTGTVYGNYLGYSELKSADEVYTIAVKELKENFDLLMLEPLGFNNTYTLSVRPDTAEKYNLKTYSDLAAVSEQLILGAGFEILNRNDGIPNLKKLYNMNFVSEIAVEGTLRYIAINADEIQVTDAFSTDGMLLKYDLIVLEDDKHYFPPYHAAPIIRAATAEKYPEVQALLGKLANILTDDTMRELNYRVDVQNEDPAGVARDFLKAKGLIG